jgi:hypothetical protein
MNSNSIEQKWDAIWYRTYWEFSTNYGVEKINERHFEETQIWTNTFVVMAKYKLNFL